MGALLCMTNSRRSGAGCEMVGVPFGSILPRFSLIKIVNDHKDAIRKMLRLPFDVTAPSETFRGLGIVWFPLKLAYLRRYRSGSDHPLRPNFLSFVSCGCDGSAAAS